MNPTTHPPTTQEYIFAYGMFWLAILVIGSLTGLALAFCGWVLGRIRRAWAWTPRGLKGVGCFVLLSLATFVALFLPLELTGTGLLFFQDGDKTVADVHDDILVPLFVGLAAPVPWLLYPVLFRVRFRERMGLRLLLTALQATLAIPGLFIMACVDVLRFIILSHMPIGP